MNYNANVIPCHMIRNSVVNYNTNVILGHIIRNSVMNYSANAIKLSIEHSTTCDSRTKLNHIMQM